MQRVVLTKTKTDVRSALAAPAPTRRRSATVLDGNVLATFTADLWDNIATCITRVVRGQHFMSLYRVTGNWAAGSLLWTCPDRGACANGCHDERYDEVQTSIWSR